MATACFLIGLATVFLLYRISQRLADIHDVLASHYVFKDMDGERAQKTREAKEAAEAVKTRGLFFVSRRSASSILRDFRMEVEAHFNELREQFESKK